MYAVQFWFNSSFDAENYLAKSHQSEELRHHYIMSSGMPELGSKISLISKADIRYEGRLFTVDPQECTIALASGKFTMDSCISFLFPLVLSWTVITKCFLHFFCYQNCTKSLSHIGIFIKIRLFIVAFCKVIWKYVWRVFLPKLHLLRHSLRMYYLFWSEIRINIYTCCCQIAVYLSQTFIFVETLP